jgi:hypothetical protein
MEATLKRCRSQSETPATQAANAGRPLDGCGESNMNYTIAAHETTYRSTVFRSRLEARWAAFFDEVSEREILTIDWRYEPIDLRGWTPDFYIKFPCWHSECSNHHELYVEVKPYWAIDEFKSHPLHNFDAYISPNPAMFGINPHITQWEMAHGAGGGTYTLDGIISVSHADIDEMWEEAGNNTRYKYSA